jgi:hypothetical protein
MRISIGSTLAALALAVSTSAHAGACFPGDSPFGDVPDNSLFCTEAMWLRNALVTLGCGNGANYCGADPVTRGQMALFMKRLARATTPDIVYAADATLHGGLDGPDGLSTCVSGTYTVPAAGANARILLSIVGGISITTHAPAFIGVTIQHSEDGILFGPLSPAMLIETSTNQFTAIPLAWAQPVTGGVGRLLNPGSTYRWRIGLQRVGVGTTGQVTAATCHLVITLPPDAAS